MDIKRIINKEVERLRNQTYYTDVYYGGIFTYEEMLEDARRNYDYGDPTNAFNDYILKNNYRKLSK